MMAREAPALNDAPHLDPTIVEEEPFEGPERNYLAHLARRHPCSIQIEMPADLIVREMKARWPFEPGAEQQARALLLRMETIIAPLIKSVHPGTKLRLVINISANPEVKVPFPDAPAIYAAFDAVHGTMRHRTVSATEPAPPDEA